MFLRRPVLIWLLAAIAVTSRSVHADEANSTGKPAIHSLRVCELRFKPAARSARFKTTVLYQAETSESGHVSGIVEDPRCEAPEPFRPEFTPVQSCLTQWRLKPSSKYTIELSWGSTGTEVVWRACSLAGDCDELVVP